MTFTPPDRTARKFDPIRDIARGNCPCGKWLVIPRSFTRLQPLSCTGPCGGPKTCDLDWFWEDDEVRSEKRKV